MRRYRTIEHTADIGIVAFGGSIEELFSNAAYGMFSLITDLKKVEPKKKIGLSLKSKELPDLLVAWLSELLYHQATSGFLLKESKIESLSKDGLFGMAWGEDYKERRHRLKREIKTVTYHQLKIERRDQVWRAQIIFDI